MRVFKNILVTGGAGFIGSNFINFLLANHYPANIVNVDKLTYAGNPENLKDVTKHTNYFFYQTDIGDFAEIENIFQQHQIDCVVHFAAESHVDRSIHGPQQFIFTNIVGTFNLLEVCRKNWHHLNKVLFHQISTDEVYGSLEENGYFTETTAYAPRSPYSASKASADHLVAAYHHTYGLPVTISNCSNNYGPYQFPEKLIPLIILNLRDKKQIPIYGDGKNIRDWLFVMDHCSAIFQIITSGKIGETYNIGGENEWENIALVKKICMMMDQIYPDFNHESLITFVADRPGHDRRYAINCDKIKQQLGWKQSLDFETGLRKTVTWYLEHQEWCQRVIKGDYQNWLHINYHNQ